MRFLRRFLARRKRPTLNDELERVYWNTVRDLEPLLRKKQDDLSDAA